MVRYNLSSTETFFLKKGDSNIVHDTCSGKILEHEISECGMNILESLTEPQNILSLYTKLNHDKKYDIEKNITDSPDRVLISRKVVVI